jgi:hypothetical protein
MCFFAGHAGVDAVIVRGVGRQRYSVPGRFFVRVAVYLMQSDTLRSAALLVLVAALARPAVAAEQVLCHYTYGGETRVLAAPPVSSPYGVKAIKVGSYFHFRVVFQNAPADLASIKVYTYSDGDDGPVPIHQATFPYPPARQQAASHGFSGLHSVYETVRDGEFQYWCELTPAGRAGRSASR